MQSRPYNRAILNWARKWGVRNLGDFVTVSVSKRMHRSLGRARVRSGLVTLSSDLRLAPRSRQLEVLCHEVAHIAAFLLFGASAKPHGPEWKALVRAAGYKPSTVMKGIRLQSQPVKSVRSVRVGFRCPVCQRTYFASRNSSRLRCSECLDSGLAGKLEPI
jgi:SprT protein